MNSARDSLRRAGADDLVELVELWVEVTAHHAALDPLFTLRSDARPVIERLIRSQLRDADAAIFVVDSQDTLAGFCCVRIDRAPPILEETRRAEITDLGVRVALRRRGLGRALAAAAFDWTVGRGVERVEVRVARRNAEGQAFWRELGFADLMDVLQRRM
ncbi:MAG: GNAT family N-acetyltransferase [Deltaproteobacteria bacterium]|nr:GNAT family N-acetyltransferase [Deltaproteobacteria bacterium]MBW2665795.1 GNAT family N-acetyltransferase [Deltaproteobacteria bacterium]